MFSPREEALKKEALPDGADFTWNIGKVMAKRLLVKNHGDLGGEH